MAISATRLLQLSHRFKRYYDRRFAPLAERTGLSVQEVHVLLFLANNPGCDTAREVAELRGLLKSQVSHAVESLAARRLLTRIPDSEDRRVIHLALTPEGMSLAKEAQAIQSACGVRLLEGLSPEETAQLHRLLEVVLSNGEHLIKEESL